MLVFTHVDCKDDGSKDRDPDGDVQSWRPIPDHKAGGGKVGRSRDGVFEEIVPAGREPGNWTHISDKRAGRTDALAASQGGSR